MRTFVQGIISRAISNRYTWPLLKPLAKVGYHIYFIKNLQEKVIIKKPDFTYLFPELTVKHGPFKGLKYPSYNSVGSFLIPKLLGSYEKEIQPVIEKCCNENYTEVIDIGCAEGYYAIGFALRLPQAKIFAYDTDERARDLCQQMVLINGVSERVTIKSECSVTELKQFPFTGRGLVICDCEGFEKMLFNTETVSNLRNCDLIIEVHDFIDIEISTELTSLFSNTHAIQIIKSIDDIEKAKTYAFPEMEGLDLNSRKEVLGEGRPAIMEWLYCTPLNVPAEFPVDATLMEAKTF